MTFAPSGFRARPLEWRIHWILRLAVALEFIGHGAFGIMTKQAWLPYYELFGIPASTALALMPLTGAVDIALGLLVLLRPTRAALLYMAFWGLYTATLRPLSGEGGWELVERAYNFGGPLALLLLHGWGATRAQWLERIRTVPRLSRERAQAFALGFRAMIAAYLVGHGALGLLTNKPGLIALYDSIGLTGLVSDPRVLNELIGSFEIALGLAVLAVPATGLLVFVCAWKLATESLFVTAGAYGAAFEVIERASAYAAPLALIWLGVVLAREERPARAPKARSRSYRSERAGMVRDRWIAGVVRERRSPPLVLAVLGFALVLLALPARASAEGKLQRPREMALLGSFGGVAYKQYEGFFVGRSSTGNYRVPYRLSAPADPGGVSHPVLVEPPHRAVGTVLRDDWLGRRFLFERGFLHGAVGYSTSTFGGDEPTNRILDPQARGVFIHGGRGLPGEDGATDDEIVVDFARALRSDKVANLLLGTVGGRYLGGVSDSADTADRVVADGRAKGVFDFVLSLTSDVFTDPQAALADGTYTGKVIAVQSEVEWSYARDDEDRGQTPDRYRHYIVPGTPHIPDGLCPGAFGHETTPASWLPAARVHFLHGHEWATHGVAPPPSTRLATTPAGDIARDPAGNALLVDIAGSPAPRLPYVELGEATFVTGFLGTYEPQPPPTIAQLGFASHPQYLAAFEEALEDQVDAGYMLQEDAEVIRHRAALSPPATFTENYFARYAQFAASESCA